MALCNLIYVLSVNNDVSDEYDASITNFLPVEFLCTFVGIFCKLLP